MTVSVATELDTKGADGAFALGGGPAALLELLDDQIARRLDRESPAVDEQPQWTVAADGRLPELASADDARLTLADGRLGTRGSVVAGAASVLAAGVYAGMGASSDLMPAPLWHRVSAPGAHATAQRILDPHTGVCRERASRGRVIEAVLLSSLARPGIAAPRVEASGQTFEWTEPVTRPGMPAAAGSPGESSSSQTSSERHGGLAVAAAQQTTEVAGVARLERIARTAYVVGAHQRVIQAALEDRYPGGGGDDALGIDYLEKVLQVTVAIPPLSAPESLTYIGLLFAELYTDAEQFEQLLAEARRLRASDLEGS